MKETEIQPQSAGVGQGGPTQAAPIQASGQRLAQEGQSREVLAATRHGHGSASAPTNRANPRFDQPQIVAAGQGLQPVRMGDQGMAVRILQQGLVDARFDLPLFGVDGIFGDETRDAVERFQADRQIPETGEADAATIQALDALHDTHETVAAIASDTDPAQPLAGTRALNAQERGAVADAISTEPRTQSGALPTFEPDNAHGNYEIRIRARMRQVIDNLYAHAQQMGIQRAQPDSLHDWGDVEQVADASKDETDRVFGAFNQGPALRAGTNLFDAWEAESDSITNTAGYADYIAQDLAGYLLNTETATINEEHGALLSRPAEADIIARIKQEFLASDHQTLLDIQISWPGLADNGQISIQRLRAADDQGNRDFMWEQFATIIHEYIHTLEHPDHVRYRSTLPEQRGGLTLREGMCDYFTKMVWDTIDFTPQLRATVEGPYHIQASHPVPQPTMYDSVAQAERAVGLVGVRNAMGGFFEGRVDLIGGP